jgi:putative transposase
MTWRPKVLTRQQMEERRLEGARLLKAGRLSQAAIARQLGVSRTAVTKWKKQLTESGLRGLKARRPRGRSRKLSANQCQRLVSMLKRGARAHGFATDRWTQRRMQQVIAREFGVTYHPKYVGRLMKALDWSVQRMERRARERDEELIRAWFSRDWPRIKKARRLVVCKLLFCCWPLRGKPQYMANCEVQNLIYAIYGGILAMSATARTHKNKPDTPLGADIMFEDEFGFSFCEPYLGAPRPDTSA